MENEKEDLEKRAMGSSVPSKLSGNCPVCKKEDSVFNYRGHVTSLKINRQPLETYNCGNCEGTFTLNVLTGKYGATFEPNDLIEPHSVKQSLSDFFRKLLIKALYAI